MSWFFPSGSSSATTTWLGATDADAEGVYRWQDGSVVEYYQNFKSGQPTGAGNENYLLMTETGEWDDRGDTDTHPFFCEYIRGMLIHYVNYLIRDRSIPSLRNDNNGKSVDIYK